MYLNSIANLLKTEKIDFSKYKIEEVFISEEKPKKSAVLFLAEDFRLAGTVFYHRTGSSMAIVSGRFLREGDMIEGHTITRIEETRVFLEKDGRTYILKINIKNNQEAR